MFSKKNVHIASCSIFSICCEHKWEPFHSSFHHGDTSSSYQSHAACNHSYSYSRLETLECSLSLRLYHILDFQALDNSLHSVNLMIDQFLYYSQLRIFTEITYSVFYGIVEPFLARYHHVGIVWSMSHPAHIHSYRCSRLLRSNRSHSQRPCRIEEHQA